MTKRINIIGNFILLCAISYGLLGCASASHPAKNEQEKTSGQSALVSAEVSAELSAPSHAANQSTKLTSLGGGTVSADAVTQITWGSIRSSIHSGELGLYTIRLLGHGKACADEPPSIVVFVAAIDAVNVTKTPMHCEQDDAIFTVRSTNPQDGQAMPGSFRYMVSLISVTKPQ